MDTAFLEWNMLAHVLLGSLALLGGLVAIISTKGSRLHVRGGWTFALAMIPVVLTTLIAMAHEFLPLAVVLAVAEIYLIPSALLSVNHDKRYFTALNLLVMPIAALLALFAAIQFVRFNFVEGQALFIGPLVIAVLFGSLLFQDIRMLKRRPVMRNFWLRRHFTRMIFAYTIGVMALVRIGIDFGLSLEMTVILPLLIATGFIAWIYRLYPLQPPGAAPQEA
ncbi:MAG: hypothetical protein R3270_03610 [Gammaproteobacteria bacterium]|nr:hypothetical protein [Gammaproteobacteria bacterium]